MQLELQDRPSVRRQWSQGKEMSILCERFKSVLWIFFIYVTTIYSDYFVVRWVIYVTLQDSFWIVTNIILYNTIMLFLIFAHYKATFTDPGYLPLPQNKVDFSDMHSGTRDEDDDSWPVCDKCETYSPPRAHHCKVCNRCVRKLDRHSYGINNCVGEENQKYFVQFLFYTLLLFSYCIILVTYDICAECVDCENNEVSRMKVLHSSLMALVCTVIIITAAVQLAQQLRSIMLGVTTIEQVQKKFSFRPHKPKFLLAAEVFGSYHIALWFIPCYKGRVKKFNDSLLSHEV